MARKRKVSSNTTATIGINISASAQKLVLQIAQSKLTNFDWGTHRDRMLKIDKAIQLESLPINRPFRKSHGYEEDTQPAIIKPEIDTAHAFFVDLFCSGDPMFKVIETNANKDGAKMMQAQVTSDELHFGLPREVSKFLRDCLKYNQNAALEVEWINEEVYQPLNDVTFSDKANNEASTTIYKGNKVKRLDPYNLLYDMSIPANEVSEKGQYAGYVERMPMTQLHQLLTSLRAVGKVVMNESKSMWESRPESTNHFVPNVKHDSNNDDVNGWGSFWFPDDAQQLHGNKKHEVSYSEHYEVTTMYMRIIPAMFGISVASSRRVQVWKFIIVNGQYIVLAERQTNAHNRIPILVCQMDDEGIWSDSKSLAEMLIPYQNQSSQMHDAQLGMIWKAVGDKGIYDARRINKRDIESNNPRAKIPARPTANNGDLRGAYVPIPYDGQASLVIQSGIDNLQRYTNSISGQNAASRGQFQKGNKTMHEYQDIMSNGDSRKYVQALLLESTVFQPLKTILKINILQFATAGKVQSNGEEVEVNPATMRQQVAEFRIADGLKNVERIAKTGTLLQWVQLMAPYANLAPAYGVDPFMMIMEGMRLNGLPLENYSPDNLNRELLPNSMGAPNESGTSEAPPQ